MKVKANTLRTGNVIEDPSHPEGLLRVEEISGTSESIIKVTYTNLTTGIRGWCFMGTLAQINIQGPIPNTKEQGK